MRWIASLWPRNAGIVGPLFYYDLARLAQRGRTTQLRCLYFAILTIALYGLGLGQFRDVGLGIGGQPYTSFLQQRAAIAHSAVLLVLSLQTGALLLLTPAYLASAFTEDKERKTLHFLFATTLRDHELVLGKLFGRLALLGTVLLVGLPVMSLSLAYGPVDFSFILVGVAASILALLSMGSVSILCSILCPNTLAAVLSSYSLVIAMNLFCFGLPAVSPLMFLTSCENQVESEWKTWEKEVADTLKMYQPGSETFVPARWGTLAPVRPPMIPKPNSAEIRLWAIVPYAIVHGLIFLFCAGLSVGIVRNFCLSPNHDFEVIARAVEPVRLSESDPPVAAWQEPAWVHHYDRPQIHVKEPALLWKEIEWGDIGMPAAIPRDWRGLLVWKREALILPAIIALACYLRWQFPKEKLADFDAGAAALIGYVTIFCMGIWSLFLAFRVSGSITREREQDTLQSLLMLPGDREEILHAKGWGNILRFGLIGYALLAVWLGGLITGVLHPLAFVLLAGACAIYLAFLAGLGVWISLSSRSTLWANLSMVLMLMLCFTTALAKRAVYAPEYRSQKLNWLTDAPDELINPGYVLRDAAFSWQASEVLSWQYDCEFQNPRAAKERERSARLFLQKLAMISLNLAFFGAAAWFFWQLSR